MRAAEPQGGYRHSCAPAIVAAGILWASHSLAQTSSSINDADVLKETENPVTRQITLPLRYQAEFPNGVSKETKHTFELNQAIVPFRLNDDWALITRTKLPMVVQPPKNQGEKWTTGLGNGYTTFFVSPEHGKGFYWGVGPLLYYPASSSMVGVNKWGSGPSAAVVKKNESPWVFGAVVNNIWTFNSGGDNRNRTNTFLLNPFVSYHIGDRWAVSSSPDITAAWIANGKKWTVPVGGGVSNLVHAGEQPIKLAVDAYYNAIRPKNHNDTTVVQFTVTFPFRD
jgi:hypothetical protein